MGEEEEEEKGKENAWEPFRIRTAASAGVGGKEEEIKDKEKEEAEEETSATLFGHTSQFLFCLIEHCMSETVAA